MTGSEHPAALPVVTSSAGHGSTLTLRDAAERLGVSLKTVRRMVDRGDLPGAELRPGPSGPQWLVSVAAIEQVLAARSQPVTSPVVRASAPPSALQDELVQLRLKVAELERRTAVAEAVAQERSQELERLHESFRVLALTASTNTEPPAGQRRWWQRRTS